MGTEVTATAATTPTTESQIQRRATDTAQTVTAPINVPPVGVSTSRIVGGPVGEALTGTTVGTAVVGAFPVGRALLNATGAVGQIHAFLDGENRPPATEVTASQTNPKPPLILNLKGELTPAAPEPQSAELVTTNSVVLPSCTDKAGK